jgi:hypothetical protein
LHGTGEEKLTLPLVDAELEDRLIVDLTKKAVLR